MRRLALVALVLVACGSAPGHAQTLTLAFTQGAEYHYTFHTTSDDTVDAGMMSTPIKVDLTAKETAKVNSVDSAGVADISLTLTGVTVKTTTAGTQTTTTTTAPLPAVDLKIGRDGRVVSVNGKDMTPFMLGASGGPNLISAVLPDTAVKPGDTWSKSFDQPDPFGKGTVHVTTNSNYLRDEALKGVNAAVVETTSTETFDLTMDGFPSAPTTTPGGSMGMSTTLKGTVKSDVTTWIDPAGHRILKSLMKADVAMTMTMVGPSSSAPAAGTGTFSIKGTQTLDLEPA
jgi:hypothetical protein